MADIDELLRRDATAQAEAVRTGEVSASELVEAAITRSEKLHASLHAVIHERYDRARSEAASADLPDGPFRGVPMVLKDLDGTLAGEPYHAGTAFLRALAHVAVDDTELVRRFKAAGFVIIGRTNTPELGLQPTTEPKSVGPTHNPWDLGRSPGGSSGGSAAAVAAGVVAVGHAGDGGGSIRIPASHCGLVGLKPSRGRITMAPVGESWAGMVARLAVTRSVRDTARLLDAVGGPAPGDPYVAPPPRRRYVDEVGDDTGGLRVGWTTAVPNAVTPCDPEVAAVVGHAAALLAELGHDVDEATPDWDDPTFTERFIDAFGVWTARELDELGSLVGQPVTEDGVEPATWAIAELGRTVTGMRYHEAIDALHLYARRLAPFWDRYDVLACPVAPEPAPPLGSFDGGPDNPLHGLFRAAEVVPFTTPFNATGQPAISVPIGTTAWGLPVGVQLVAPAGRDDLCIRVAAQLERACPWSHRSPALA